MEHVLTVLGLLGFLATVQVFVFGLVYILTEVAGKLGAFTKPIKPVTTNKFILKMEERFYGRT